MSETFYDVLGVGPDATTEEITTAYRDRIKETHPDLSDDDDAKEQSRGVIQAKEVLTDEDERARYDRLGHDDYVRQTNVDADWGGAGGSDDTAPWRDTSTAAEQAASSRTGTDTTGTESGSAESTWAGRDERRRGRTGTDWVGDAGRSRSDDATTGTGSAGTDGTAAASAGASSDADDSKRRRTTATDNVGETVGWASGVDGRHAIRHGTEREGAHRSRLFPPRDSLVLLLSTFISYPTLVFASVPIPNVFGVPLVVNLIVGVCTLIVIAYLMSIPEVGAYVFGAWSVLATLITLASGFSAFSLIGVFILGSTWIPFGLTLVTYHILRW